MKKRYSYILGLMSLVLPLSANSQVITDFEETTDVKGYKALGVYDAWPESPFRIQPGATAPRLEGNVQVIANTIQDEANGTGNMLMVQRSRYGSNQFGARIDLITPFELTTSTKYVHVMIKKDKPGRVLLIGLGNRTDRPGQSPETPQCWALSSKTVVPGVWNDAVFAIKGNGGIDIKSLVIVPDCEPTHELTEDFLAYIDEIEVNTSSSPRFSREDYPLNIETNTTVASDKSDRHVRSISLTSPSDGAQTITVGSASPQTIYRPKLSSSFCAKAGETVTPSIDYSAGWMNGYVYLDKDRDGKFSWETGANHVRLDSEDLVSFYYIEDVENTSGYNYLGQAVNGNARNTIQTPAFKIPADLAPGFYRMRFKVDWGDADPAGRMTATNSIVQNGGSIVDVRLNIHNDEVTVSTEYQNGDIYAADGSNLSGKKVAFGKDVTIKMVPENGFVADGITLTHGYNVLSGDSIIHSTRQFEKVRIPGFAVTSEGLLTIPAEYVDGDLHILAHFKSSTGGDAEEGNYETNFDKASVVISRTDRTLNTVGLSGDQGCSFTSSKMSTQPKTVYQDKTSDVAIAQQGEVLTPSVSYTTGGPMHGYFYIDMNNDGIFSIDIDPATNRPTAGSELVSYSYRGGFNSEGTSRGNTETNNTITFPPFTMPAFLADGVYRARVKIDWDNDDPKGQYGATNSIESNGGYIVDFLISVSKGEKTLKVESMHGNVYATNGALPHYLAGTSVLNAVFKPVTTDYALAEPIEIKSGLNFDGPQYVKGNQQWYTRTISADELAGLSSVQIPVYGDVEIKANFAPASDSPEYKLVFNDEFNEANGTVPNAKKWQASQRMSSTWNRWISDKQEVAHHEDGNMTLLAIPNPDKTSDKADMLTGAIESRNLFSYRYGKLECRAKTNGYTGNFPAIWLMPQEQSAGWPDCGEIDIFEQIDAEARSYHTIHSNWTYDLGYKNNPQSSFNKSLSMDRYHTYGLEWDETSLKWYVDGALVGTYAKQVNNQNALNQGQWPFDKEFYIILNQSVGNGSWAANADINHTYRFDVDWVRVYQKDGQSHTSGVKAVTADPITVRTEGSKLIVTTSENTLVSVYSVNGQCLFNEMVDGVRTLDLNQGFYIVNNHKAVIR